MLAVSLVKALLGAGGGELAVPPSEIRSTQALNPPAVSASPFDLPDNRPLLRLDASSGQLAFACFPASSANYEASAATISFQSLEARSQSEQFFSLVLERTPWPFNSADLGERSVNGQTLSPEQIDSLFAWAASPEVGIVSAPLERLIDPQGRLELATSFAVLSNNPELVAEMRSQVPAIISMLRVRNFISAETQGVLQDPQVVPLLLYWRLEDLAHLEPKQQPTLSIREGWGAELAALAMFAGLPRDAATVGVGTARSLETLDRRLADCPPRTLLDFGASFFQTYSDTRSKHFGDTHLDLRRHGSAKLQRFYRDLVGNLSAELDGSSDNSQP